LASVKERINKIRWIGTVLRGARTQREITGLRHVGPYVGFTTCGGEQLAVLCQRGEVKNPQIPSGIVEVSL